MSSGNNCRLANSKKPYTPNEKETYLFSFLRSSSTVVDLFKCETAVVKLESNYTNKSGDKSFSCGECESNVELLLLFDEMRAIFSTRSFSLFCVPWNEVGCLVNTLGYALVPAIAIHLQEFLWTWALYFSIQCWVSLSIIFIISYRTAYGT